MQNEYLSYKLFLQPFPAFISPFLSMALHLNNDLFTVKHHIITQITSTVKIALASEAFTGDKNGVKKVW